MTNKTTRPAHLIRRSVFVVFLIPLVWIALLISGNSTHGRVDAQNKTTREATYALLGPVRTVRTEEASVFKKDGQFVEGPRVLRMTISFNEDGSRPELCLYDEKGALSRRIVMRFESGKQVEFLNYDGAGGMWLRGVTLYDTEGRVRESATYNGDGSLRSRTTLTRNPQGQVIELAEYDPKGTLLEKRSNRFNQAGELKATERSIYRTDGSLRVKESYDAAQKQMESITYNQDGTLAGKTIRANQQIDEFGPDGSLKKSTFITNIGRLPEEVTYNSDGPTKKESQVADEIDAHGNWVKQTKWVSDAQGTKPAKVTYRVITYY